MAAEELGFAQRDFVAQIDIIVHGSTVATNALVERKIARAGLIVNHGHADILTLREGPRKGAFEWRLDYPDPYIPRKLTRTVRGRIDVRGRELVPLSVDDVQAAAEHFRQQAVGSIAVGLLWSVVNPNHEIRTREILSTVLPDVPVTLSHEINPIPREYRRVIAAAIDASISPIIRIYVQRLRDALVDAGFKGELLLANCLGGMMPPEEIVRRPIYSVMSGPTLAPIAALALTKERDVVVGDMGGTSFDVSALRNHKSSLRRTPRSTMICLAFPKSTYARLVPAAVRSRTLTQAGSCMSARTARALGRDRPVTGWAALEPPSPTPMSCSGYSIRTFFWAAASGSIVG